MRVTGRWTYDVDPTLRYSSCTGTIVGEDEMVSPIAEEG